MANIPEILTEIEYLVQKDPDFRNRLQLIINRFSPSIIDFQGMIKSSEERFFAVQKENRESFQSLQQEMREEFAKRDKLLAESNYRIEATQKEMREQFAKSDARFETQRKESNEHFEAMQKEISEGFAKSDARFEAQRQENTSNVERIITSLGARWGIRSESFLRNTLSHVVTENFNGKIEKIKVGGTEIDIVASNGKIMVIEMCSKALKKDLKLLIDKGKLIHKQKGKKPKLVLATADIHIELARQAEELGIKIITRDLDDDEEN